MYCALCRRPVEARRVIGAGTIILGVVTAGLSLLAIPFYQKRCAICKSTAVLATAGELPDDASRSRLDELERRLRVVEHELEESGSQLRRLTEERDFYARLLGAPPDRTSRP